VSITHINSGNLDRSSRHKLHPPLTAGNRTSSTTRSGRSAGTRANASDTDDACPDHDQIQLRIKKIGPRGHHLMVINQEHLQHGHSLRPRIPRWTHPCAGASTGSPPPWPNRSLDTPDHIAIPPEEYHASTAP
jgi:hypothetical protein